jgi:hypothetical protein
MKYWKKDKTRPKPVKPKHGDPNTPLMDRSAWVQKKLVGTSAAQWYSSYPPWQCEFKMENLRFAHTQYLKYGTRDEVFLESVLEAKHFILSKMEFIEDLAGADPEKYDECIIAERKGEYNTGTGATYKLTDEGMELIPFIHFLPMVVSLCTVCKLETYCRTRSKTAWEKYDSQTKGWEKDMEDFRKQWEERLINIERRSGWKCPEDIKEKAEHDKQLAELTNAKPTPPRNPKLEDEGLIPDGFAMQKRPHAPFDGCFHIDYPNMHSCTIPNYYGTELHEIFSTRSLGVSDYEMVE